MALQVKFPVDQWLSALNLETDRQAYRDMTPAQQKLVRWAYLYGIANAQLETRAQLEQRGIRADNPVPKD